MLDFIMLVCLIIVVTAYIDKIMLGVTVGGVCLIAAMYITGNVSPEAWTFLKGAGAIGLAGLIVLTPALLLHLGVFVYKRAGKGRQAMGGPIERVQKQF